MADHKNATSIRVGLIVNPIAGMGGSVGLKGTDGDLALQARALGARPVTPARTRAFLAALEGHESTIRWLIAPGPMGADHVSLRGSRVVGQLSEAQTRAEDTRRIARLMVQEGIDLLVFVGGDGTARDIFDAVGTQVPVVGVPAGVKVYSGVFALSPRAAAEMVRAFADGAGVTEAEVLDIDEEAFRAGRLEAHLYGYLLVPDVPPQLQPSKEGTRATPDTVANREDIAAAMVELMKPDILYLLGPGTTVKAVADELGVPKTLLGIDAVYDRQVVAMDLNEQQILELLKVYPQREIVVTPLGGNGFLFGRGNKPFTPAVIRQVGREHILVIATEGKIRQVGHLRVDTGDPEVDALLQGYIEVMIGYHYYRVVKVVAT